MKAKGLMIEFEELTDEHYGSKVIYIPPHAKGDASHSDSQGGTISSWNHKYVFVEFGVGTPHAVRPFLLVWG